MDQNQFNTDEVEIIWQSELSDSLVTHQLKRKPNFTRNEYENPENLRLRAICYLLLDYLSEEGLEEIKEALLEAIKFYRNQLESSEPFHLTESFEVAIGEGYERPVFQIAED